MSSSKIENDLHEKLKQKTASRLVNSPHAKYNSRDELMCIVCGCKVKSAIVWQAHIAKKSHLENLKNLQLKQEQLNMTFNNLKRKQSNSREIPASKKLAVPDGLTAPKPKGILKISYDASSSDEEDTGINIPKPETEHANSPIKSEVKDEDGEEQEMEIETYNTVTADDPQLYYIKESDKFKENRMKNSELPEGFFDDPIADAKARNVEYVDKDEAEWNAFMKAVSAEASVSKQIIDVDAEEAALRNQVWQVEEQMQLYKRVLEFDRARQEVQHFTPSCGTANSVSDARAQDSSDSDLNDDDIHCFNWRKKRFL